MRDLLAADLRYRAAIERTEKARQERNALIRAAVEEGFTPSQVARTLGVTRARVAQILDKP